MIWLGMTQSPEILDDHDYDISLFSYDLSSTVIVPQPHVCLNFSRAPIFRVQLEAGTFSTVQTVTKNSIQSKKWKMQSQNHLLWEIKLLVQPCKAKWKYHESYLSILICKSMTSAISQIACLLIFGQIRSLGTWNNWSFIWLSCNLVIIL